MRKRINLVETIWSTVLNEKMDNTLIFSHTESFDEHMSNRLKDYFDRFPLTRYTITVKANENYLKVNIKETNGDFRKEDTYEWV